MAHTTKGKDWEYEQEWRIIALPTMPYHSASRRSYEFPPETLVGVIFGEQMDDEHETKIRDWVQTGKSRPRFCKARKKAGEFALVIEPCKT
jgi:hypothetical protein